MKTVTKKFLRNNSLVGSALFAFWYVTIAFDASFPAAIGLLMIGLFFVGFCVASYRALRDPVWAFLWAIAWLFGTLIISWIAIIAVFGLRIHHI